MFNTQMIRNSLVIWLFSNLNLSVYRKTNSKTPRRQLGLVNIFQYQTQYLSNLIATPIFLCNSNPRDLVESFIDAVEGLATQSKAQMKLQFLELETAIKSKLTRTLESLNERRCRNQRVFEFEDLCFEDDNEEKDASTQFLQMQKNQFIELQEHLERYCNV